jgi:hypothetical protein
MGTTNSGQYGQVAAVAQQEGQRGPARLGQAARCRRPWMESYLGWGKKDEEDDHCQQYQD